MKETIVVLAIILLIAVTISYATNQNESKFYSVAPPRLLEEPVTIINLSSNINSSYCPNIIVMDTTNKKAWCMYINANGEYAPVELNYTKYSKYVTNR